MGQGLEAQGKGAVHQLRPIRRCAAAGSAQQLSCIFHSPAKMPRLERIDIEGRSQQGSVWAWGTVLARETRCNAL